MSRDTSQQDLIERIMQALQNGSLPELLVLAGDLAQQASYNASETTGVDVVGWATKMLAATGANMLGNQITLPSIEIAGQKIPTSIFFKIALFFSLNTLLEKGKQELAAITMKYRRAQIANQEGVRSAQKQLQVIITSKQRDFRDKIVSQIEAGLTDDYYEYLSEPENFPNPSDKISSSERDYYPFQSEDGGLLRLTPRRLSVVPKYDADRAVLNDIVKAAHTHIMILEGFCRKIKGDDKALIEFGLMSIRNQYVRLLELIKHGSLSVEKAKDSLHRLNAHNTRMIDLCSDRFVNAELADDSAVGLIGSVMWSGIKKTASVVTDQYLSDVVNQVSNKEVLTRLKERVNNESKTQKDEGLSTESTEEKNSSNWRKAQENAKQFVTNTGTSRTAMEADSDAISLMSNAVLAPLGGEEALTPSNAFKTLTTLADTLVSALNAMRSKKSTSASTKKAIDGLVKTQIDSVIKKQGEFVTWLCSGLEIIGGVKDKLAKGIESSAGAFVARLLRNASVLANTATHEQITNEAYISEGDWGRLLQMIFGRGIAICVNKQHGMHLMRPIPFYVANDDLSDAAGQANAFIQAYEEDEKNLLAGSRKNLKIFQLKQGIRHVLCRLMSTDNNDEKTIANAHYAISRALEQIAQLDDSYDMSPIKRILPNLGELADKISIHEYTPPSSFERSCQILESDLSMEADRDAIEKAEATLDEIEVLQNNLRAFQQQLGSISEDDNETSWLGNYVRSFWPFNKTAAPTQGVDAGDAQADNPREEQIINAARAYIERTNGEETSDSLKAMQTILNLIDNGVPQESAGNEELSRFQRKRLISKLIDCLLLTVSTLQRDGAIQFIDENSFAFLWPILNQGKCTINNEEDKQAVLANFFSRYPSDEEKESLKHPIDAEGLLSGITNETEIVGRAAGAFQHYEETREETKGKRSRSQKDKRKKAKADASAAIQEAIAFLHYQIQEKRNEFVNQTDNLKAPESNPLCHLPKTSDSYKDLVKQNHFLWKAAKTVFWVSVSTIGLVSGGLTIAAATYGVYASGLTWVNGIPGGIAIAVGIAAAVICTLALINMIKRNTGEQTVRSLKATSIENLVGSIRAHVNKKVTSGKTSELPHNRPTALGDDSHYQKQALKYNAPAQLAYNLAKHRSSPIPQDYTASVKGFSVRMLADKTQEGLSGNASQDDQEKATLASEAAQFTLYELVRAAIQHCDPEILRTRIIGLGVGFKDGSIPKDHHALAKELVEKLANNPAHADFTSYLITSVGNWYSDNALDQSAPKHFINNPFLTWAESRARRASTPDTPRAGASRPNSPGTD